jgi:hypothetical protein
VREHAFFERHEHDLHCTIPLNVAQAALGCEIDVPTFEGPQRLKIPEGTQSGAQFKLRHKGVAVLNGGGRGDLIVHIDVKVPTRLSRDQRRLLEQLRESLPVNNAPSEKGLFDKVKDYFVIESIFIRLRGRKAHGETTDTDRLSYLRPQGKVTTTSGSSDPSALACEYFRAGTGANPVRSLRVLGQTLGRPMLRIELKLHRILAGESPRAGAFRTLAGLIVLGIWPAPPAGMAQDFRGSLAGTVSDASGGRVGSAVILLRAAESSVERTARSDGRGEFGFPDLLPGSYQLRVEAPGLQRPIPP